MDRIIEQYKNKKILIVGLGVQGGGAGLARFFAELNADVTVTDKKTAEQLQESIVALQDYKIKYSLGKHMASDFIEADIIFKGPSIRWDSPEILLALNKGIPVEMEASFFAQHCPANIIGITGTRGKSTTTQLIFELLKQTGKNVYLGGNIPHISTIELLKRVTKDDYVVLELSSWGLSGFHRKKISPHIAVFTSFYPDHLNYYKTMEEYFYDKAAIYMYQKNSDYLVYNEQIDFIRPATLHQHLISFSSKNFSIIPHFLKGEHNLENISAAMHVSKILKLDSKKTLAILEQFKGLPYRQQIIGTKDLITFINDTTSTTPVAAVKAIDSFQDKKIVMIIGGNSKGLPLDKLIEKLSHVEQIILLEGSFTQEIMAELKNKYADKISPVYNSLDAAVSMAMQKATELKESAYVLFSPGATSFAMFKNEFHRGDEFNRLVREFLK